MSNLTFPFFLGFAISLSAQEPVLPVASVVKISADQGHGSIRQGSGVVVRAGIVATNAHVTAGALNITVSHGTNTWQVQSRKDDLLRDLSVLMVPGLPLPPAPLATTIPPLCEAVTAVGFPAGLGPTSTRGHLTGLWSYLGSHVLQSDALTAPGSSGGGLFDSEGRLLGLTTFIFPKSAHIHFSIPVQWISDLIEDPDAKAASLALPTGPQFPGFIDALGSAPENHPAWDAFTRTWVEGAPDDPDAWFAYANSLEPSREPGLIHDRIAAYRRSLVLQSDSPKAWNNLGASLGLLNRFKEAEAAYGKALALNPSYSLAWLNLGATLLDERRNLEAVAALSRGLDLQPDDVHGWQRLGDAHMNLNHPTEAARHYRTALGLSPFRTEVWADLARACDKAQDPQGLQEALAKLAALDATQAAALAKELKRSVSR